MYGYRSYDDYYREPSEAEIIIYEAQERLSELVKPELKEELEKLNNKIFELENEKRVISTEKSSLKRKLDAIQSEHEKEIENLKKNFIKNVSETLAKEYWSVRSRFVRKDGKILQTINPKVKVKETIELREFYIETKSMKFIETVKTHDGNNVVLVWNDNDEDAWANRVNLEINESFTPEEFGNKNRYNQVFTKKEDAQLYADYLNSVEAERPRYQIVDDGY